MRPIVRIAIAACIAPLLAIPTTSATAATAGSEGDRGSATRIKIIKSNAVDEGNSMVVTAKARILPIERRELMLFQVQEADGTWRNLDHGGTNKRGVINVEGRVGEGSYTLRVASPGGRGHLRTSPTWSVDNPPPPPPPDHDYTDAEGVQAILEAINDVRRDHDLRPVALDTYYSQAAQEQAIDVANGAEVRYIGEYLHHYDQHPEYPRDSWKSFSGCYGFNADPTTWDLETDRFLNPDFEAVMIGFTERRPGADNNPVSGRWAVSLYMFQRDHDAHTP